MPTIFITGGTGYMGTRLIKMLLAKGYKVIALTREHSRHKVPTGATIVIGNPFDEATFYEFIPKGCVFVQLLGVPHPSPAKAAQFTSIDLASVKASANAAVKAGVSHFIYVSVSMQQSKLMQAYQQVRRQGEAYCMLQQLNCTFIRPWYVLGPGHWWPVILLPLYALANMVPVWKQKVAGMELVTLRQMLATLINATAATPQKQTIVEIADVKKAQRNYPLFAK
jgi:nucleoside-diphosphate-sugar epimerase